MKNFKSFETERLYIRPTNEEDALFLLGLMNTPKWLQFIGDRNIKTLDHASMYIKNKIIPQLHRLGYSNYTIIRKGDNTKLGTCGLYDRNGLEGIDIGFALLPEHEGNGYALEATYRLQQAAFEEFGLNHLSAITAKDNTASQGLLVKLKFKLTGTVVLPEDTETLLLFTNQLG